MLTCFVLLCLFLFWFCKVDDSFRENTNKTTVHIFFQNTILNLTCSSQTILSTTNMRNCGIALEAILYFIRSHGIHLLILLK